MKSICKAMHSMKQNDIVNDKKHDKRGKLRMKFEKNSIKGKNESPV